MNIRYLLFAVIIALGASAFADVEELPNLSLVKEKLIAYHDSGAYYRQVGSVIKQAKFYLDFRINQNNRLLHPRKLAIVLDIDETTLSNYTDMLHLNFGGTKEQVEELVTAGHDQAIPATLVLYKYAQQRGVAVFFVSNRHEYQRRSTDRNLNSVGFHRWQDLYLEPDSYDKPSALTYKIAARKAILRRGYDIVLNIGDQVSDTTGGAADMAFRLPNPFYHVT